MKHNKWQRVGMILSTAALVSSLSILTMPAALADPEVPNATAGGSDSAESELELPAAPVASADTSESAAEPLSTDGEEKAADAPNEDSVPTQTAAAADPAPSDPTDTEEDTDDDTVDMGDDTEPLPNVPLPNQQPIVQIKDFKFEVIYPDWALTATPADASVRTVNPGESQTFNYDVSLTPGSFSVSISGNFEIILPKAGHYASQGAVGAALFVNGALCSKDAQSGGKDSTAATPKWDSARTQSFNCTFDNLKLGKNYFTMTFMRYQNVLSARSSKVVDICTRLAMFEQPQITDCHDQVFPLTDPDNGVQTSTAAFTHTLDNGEKSQTFTDSFCLVDAGKTVKQVDKTVTLLASPIPSMPTLTPPTPTLTPPTPTSMPTTPAPAVVEVDTPATASQPKARVLAQTGSDASGLATLAALLIGAGLVLSRQAHRRSQRL